MREGCRRCDGVTWLLSASDHTVALFEHGQIQREEAGRLAVTLECALLIKRVSGGDAGLYTCRKFSSSGEQQGDDSSVLLSVVSSEFQLRRSLQI